jgi:hypothetical protein
MSANKLNVTLIFSVSKDIESESYTDELNQKDDIIKVLKEALSEKGFKLEYNGRRF